MNRQQKYEEIDSLKQELKNCEGVFLVNVQGLTVAQSETLRKGVRGAGGFVRVVKNTLVKKAIDDMGVLADISAMLHNQIALVLTPKNATAAAKVLSDFVQENEPAQLVAGFFENKILDKAQVRYIGSLPSKEVLIARICGALKSPLIRVSYVLTQKQ